MTGRQRGWCEYDEQYEGEHSFACILGQRSSVLPFVEGSVDLSYHDPLLTTGIGFSFDAGANELVPWPTCLVATPVLHLEFETPVFYHLESRVLRAHSGVLRFHS